MLSHSGLFGDWLQDVQKMEKRVVVVQRRPWRYKETGQEVAFVQVAFVEVAVVVIAVDIAAAVDAFLTAEVDVVAAVVVAAA